MVLDCELTMAAALPYSFAAGSRKPIGFFLGGNWEIVSIFRHVALDELDEIVNNK